MFGIHSGIFFEKVSTGYWICAFTNWNKNRYFDILFFHDNCLLLIKSKIVSAWQRKTFSTKRNKKNQIVNEKKVRAIVNSAFYFVVSTNNENGHSLLNPYTKIKFARKKNVFRWPNKVEMVKRSNPIFAWLRRKKCEQI